jgi:uncharacterized HhH-GPD family protein
MSEVMLRKIIDKRTANAFLFGNIFNQQQSSGQSFLGPYILEERLSSIDPAFILQCEFLELINCMSQKPAIHPMARTMTQRIISASQLLVDKYGSDARNIWDNIKDPGIISKRLIEFPGIGLHKAQVALYLLSTYVLEDINIELDFDVEKVCTQIMEAKFTII